MKKINGWLYAFWIALIVILIMALAVGLISWAGSGAEESEGSGTDEEEPGDDDGDPEIVGENTLTIEAEDSALFNSMSSSASSTTLIGTEQTTLSDDTVITNVKNFNTEGDKIVFQVLASAAIENVAISITAGNGATFGGTFADNDKILTVNGGEPVSLTGTLTNSAFNWSTYGTLTGTISLNAGINYIEITAATTSGTGYLNVDRIDLSWDGETTIEAVNDYTGEVFDVDATGVATLEAEDASLMNAAGVSGSTYLLGTEADSNDESVTQVNNFNAKGDMIVYQVLAAAAIENVSLDLYARLGGTHSDAYDSDNFISVNGEAVSHTGSVVSSSYGDPVTATISLQKGINYIVIEMEETGSTFLGMNMGLMNVDRIDLNGGTYKEPATEVSDETGLVEALEAGGDIVLTTDITVGEEVGEADTAALTVSEDTEIDLAGNSITTGTLSSALNTIEVEEGATLTITDSTGEGAIENTYATHVSNDNAAAIKVDGGDLIIEGGTIESSSVGVRALEGSVTINGGTVYSSGYYALWESEGTVDVTINDGIVGGSYAGILVDGDSNFGYANSALQEGAVTTLTINGGVVYSGGEGQAAIRTESMTSKDSAIITINGGLVYGAQAAPGIFLGNGTLEITDGIIAGSTAAEVQAGDVTISGGVFYATDDEQKITYTTANSASFTNGYALSIIPRGNVWRVASDDSFSMALIVTVTGGTFYGDVYVAATSVLADTDGSTWTLNDETNGKYKVTGLDDLAAGMTCTTVYDETENEVVVAYVYSVTRISAVKTDDTRLTVKDQLAFDASDITVAYDLTTNTYTISGTSSTMGQDLAKAVYGESHKDCEYITFEVVANAGETVTISSYNGETCDGTWTLYGTETDGTSTTDGLFVLDLTNHNEGAWKMVIEVSDGTTTYTYTVVRGTITSAAADDPE